VEAAHTFKKRSRQHFQGLVFRKTVVKKYQQGTKKIKNLPGDLDRF